MFEMGNAYVPRQIRSEPVWAGLNEATCNSPGQGPRGARKGDAGDAAQGNVP